MFVEQPLALPGSANKMRYSNKVIANHLSFVHINIFFIFFISTAKTNLFVHYKSIKLSQNVLVWSKKVQVVDVPLYVSIVQLLDVSKQNYVMISGASLLLP